MWLTNSKRNFNGTIHPPAAKSQICQGQDDRVSKRKVNQRLSINIQVQLGPRRPKQENTHMDKIKTNLDPLNDTNTKLLKDKASLKNNPEKCFKGILSAVSPGRGDVYKVIRTLRRSGKNQICQTTYDLVKFRPNSN